MKTTLCLLRHGQSESNVDHSLCEKHEQSIGLTDLGMNQAAEAAIKVTNVIKDNRPMYSSRAPTVLVSPYRRVIETVDIIKKTGLFKTYRTEPLLSEWYTGQSKPYHHVTDYIESITYVSGYQHDRQSEKWNRQGNTRPHAPLSEPELHEVISETEYCPPGGESELEVYTRVGLLVEKFDWFSGNNYIIVSHGTCCDMLHWYLTGKEVRGWKNCQVAVYGVAGRLDVSCYEIDCT